MGRRRWLEEGEVVLYAARPHPVVLARTLLGALGAVGLASFAFVAWASAPVWFGAVLAAVIVLAALFVAGRVLRYRAGLLMVTSRRIAHREGFVRRVGREIPITKVEDVTYAQSLLARVLGYGEVTVESAGAQAARPFVAVRRPEEVQHAIHRAAQAAVRHHPAAAPAARAPRVPDRAEPDLPPERGAHGVEEQLALLEALHRRGFVSEEELEEKRLELLGRH